MVSVSFSAARVAPSRRPALGVPPTCRTAYSKATAAVTAAGKYNPNSIDRRACKKRKVSSDEPSASTCTDTAPRRSVCCFKYGQTFLNRCNSISELVRVFLVSNVFINSENLALQEEHEEECGETCREAV